MKVSFNGIRRSMASEFNRLYRYRDGHMSEHEAEIFDDLRSLVGGMLAIYDPTDKDDCDDLSDEVELLGRE